MRISAMLPSTVFVLAAGCHVFTGASDRSFGDGDGQTGATGTGSAGSGAASSGGAASGGGATGGSGAAGPGGSGAGGAVICDENFALSFDGEDDLVEVIDHPALDGHGPLTIEAWVSVGPKTLMEEGQILSHHHAGDNEGYVLMLEGQGHLHMRFQANGQSHRVGDAATTTIADFDWHHVAGSFDGTTLRMFIDGELKASAPSGASVAEDFAGPLRIGASAYNDSWRFEGIIDEVRLSDEARYLASFTPPTGPFTVDTKTIALWHFDEGQGQSTSDAAGTHHGLLGNGQAANDKTPIWVSVPCIGEMQ